MRRHIVALAPRRDRGQHPGLLLQRYLAIQSSPESDQSPAAGQQKS